MHKLSQLARIFMVLSMLVCCQYTVVYGLHLYMYWNRNRSWLAEFSKFWNKFYIYIHVAHIGCMYILYYAEFHCIAKYNFMPWHSIHRSEIFENLGMKATYSLILNAIILGGRLCEVAYTPIPSGLILLSTLFIPINGGGGGGAWALVRHSYASDSGACSHDFQRRPTCKARERSDRAGACRHVEPTNVVTPSSNKCSKNSSHKYSNNSW